MWFLTLGAMTAVNVEGGGMGELVREEDEKA